VASCAHEEVDDERAGMKRRQTQPWLRQALNEDKDGVEPVGARGAARTCGRRSACSSRNKVEATRLDSWPGVHTALGAGHFLHGPQAGLQQLGPISRSIGLHCS
jgi:hypothetical protein